MVREPRSALVSSEKALGTARREAALVPVVVEQLADLREARVTIYPKRMRGRMEGTLGNRGTGTAMPGRLAMRTRTRTGRGKSRTFLMTRRLGRG